MDETYQAYLNRVAKLTLPASYQSQLQTIQKSPKFQGGQAIPFPGYTINSPACPEDPVNHGFYAQLRQDQAELVAKLGDLVIPVPPDSFHLTLADLIWDGAYEDAVSQDREYEQKLCDRIDHSFQQYQDHLTDTTPLTFQLVGVIMRPRAIAVGLIPQNETSHEKLRALRRSLYQNAELIGLGIEQQYRFTAHITLCYFNEIPPSLDRDRLCEILVNFNDRWIGTDPQVFALEQAELQHFEDMTRYSRKPHFPTVKL
ncbi:hypothetical protein [Spirulina subsalsa]|uniref:hypothetical protein n=1 Tax=Spirulina subsalsa TaxID=54311 RepID=UPI0002E110E4|nr:hypothetical protein [Spirulina subsalsa]